MSHGIFIKGEMMATNIDALVKNAIASVDLDNGSVVQLTTKTGTTGEKEVYNAAVPTTGNLSNLYIVAQPEIVVTVSGTKQFKGIDADVRDFYNIAGDVFTALRLNVGDTVTLSEDALAGTKGVNTYVVATNGAAKLTWAAAAVSGVSLKLQETTYITVGSTRVTAYKFIVEAVA